MKTIKTKIMRSFLAVSIISLAVASLFSEINMWSLRDIMTRSNEQIGGQAADSSENALVDQAIENITRLAEAKAQVIDEELNQVAKSLSLIAGYVGHMYTYPEEFKLIPYHHAKDCPADELSMQWVLSPGMTLESVMEETYLHGNMKSVYDAVMKSNPSVSSIYLTTATGINSGYDAYAARKPEEFEGRFLDWYVAAKDSGGLVISDTYRDSFGRGLTVSMSMPCYGRDGVFVGVVGLDILIENMNEMILQTTVGENGYAVLLKGTDKIISAPGLDETDETDMAFFLGDAHGEILSGISELSSGVVKSRIPHGSAGEDVYVIWSPVEISDWSFLFVLPVEDIIAPAVEARQNIEALAYETASGASRRILSANLILIALFITIIGFVIWTTRRISGKITQPIAALTNDVKAIGDGNLDYVSNIRTGDEIELLSRSFEHMTAELKEYIRNLGRITAEKERIATELGVATKIQAGMLPCIFPPFPERKEFDIYATMLPAKEVGGDFYDFFLTDEDNLTVVIADVSGKGVPAALFMVIAKTLIKNNACSGLSPGEVFEKVNNMLCENNEAGMFVTAFMGCLNIPTGRFTYVNAGHNPPLVMQSGGDYEWLPAKPGLVLAAMEDIPYSQYEITLKPGDTLYLYTDGVTEAVDENDALFSEARLLVSANSRKEKPVAELLSGIKEDIDRFANGTEQADDITMLALRVNGDKPGCKEETLRMKELEIGAEIENLGAVTDFIDAELEQSGCAQKLRSQIAVVVEEIFVNIVHYAYHPEVGGAMIRVSAGEEIVIEFEDLGVPYNPLEKPDPDISKSAEEREIGGLGIFMVKQIMDRVEYRREGNKNILMIRKAAV